MDTPLLRRLGGVIAAMFLACHVAQSNEPQLQLHEIFSLALPESTHVDGATVSSDGVVVFWDRSQGVVRIRDTHGNVRAMPRTQNLSPVYAVYDARDSTVSVVDALTSGVLKTDMGGRALRYRRIPLGRAIDVAAYADGAWYAGGADATGMYWVGRWPSGPRGDSLVPMREPDGRDSTGNTLLLSGAERGLLVSSIRPPLRTYLLTDSGLSLAFDIDTSAFPPAGAGRQPREWVGLQVVRLDSHYLRTVADLASDVRVVVLSSGSGHARRTLTVGAPLNFLASNDSPRLIVAVRRTTSEELVGYRWSWTSRNHPSQ